jgi:4-amino-4-deoxy-L-arabinose transferase-like glycosyltransferase
MERMTKVRATWLVIPFVLLFFFLALDSMVDDSPTMDEQNHIARGLAFLRTGDPRLSLEHPPLINALSALPLLMLPDVRLPTDHPSWERREGWYEFASVLLWEQNRDVGRMVFLARIPILFLTLGLALVCFQFARQLWGRAAAMVAFPLTLFEPNILAHGRYSTTDLGATMFIVLATFLLWRLWRCQGGTTRRWALATVGIGLALGAKLSAVVFVPIWAAMALIPVSPAVSSAPYWQESGRRLIQLATAGLCALLVLWAVFGFQWGDLAMQTPSLRFLDGVSAPMPTYWAGLEQIAQVTGTGRGNTFLLGKISDQGFLAYFPVTFLAKTPLPILLLLLVSVLMAGKRRMYRNLFFLLLPALLYFGLSVTSALNIGYRHLLPMLPFLLLLISSFAVELGDRKRESEGGCMSLSTRWRRVATSGKIWTTAAIISLIVSDLLIHPHYLSYFNVAAGGPEQGRQIVVDSNIDWGQDLLRLKSWMEDNQVDEVNLGWFGSADPGYYGIKHRPLPGLGRDPFFPLWWDVPFDRVNPEPGVYAISVTNLWELPLSEGERSVYGWFRERQPDEQIGYSILIFEVP